MQDQVPAGVPQARKQRREVELPAFALRADGTCLNVTLLDLSYDGCLFSSEAPFGVGERLRLIVRSRGVIDAEVRWLEEGRVGVRFAQDLAA